MKNRKLALFDFDGTITKEDTFIEFIKFAKGEVRFITGFGLLAPILILMKLKLYPNWRAKERVMSFFFSGTSKLEFDTLCAEFASERVPGYVRSSALQKLHFHKERGDLVIIITASFENWLAAWAKPVCDLLLGTKLEIKNNTVTGKIEGKNCYGEEKVNRLRNALDLSEFNEIHAYGDSRGDKEMLTFSTHPNFKVFK